MKNPLVVNPYAKRKYTQTELDAIPDLRPDLSEAGKGIRAFVDETQAAGYGIRALGAQYLKDTFNASDNGFLAKQVKVGQEGYARNIKEATAGRQAPNVARIEDIKGAGGFADWAVYNVAKGIPQVGMAFTGAGAGALAAKTLVKKGLKNQAKNAITKEMQDEAKAAIRKQVVRGAGAGGFGATFGLEGGHAMGQALEEGVDPSIAKISSTAVGGINGALELFTPFMIAKSFGRGDFAKKSIRDIIKNDPGLSKKAMALAALKETGARVGKGAGKGVGVEGLTEGLQELTNIAAMRWAKGDPIFASLDDEDWSQVMNSAAAGGLVGGTISGGAAAFSGPTEAEQAGQIIPPKDEAAADKLDLTQEELTLKPEPLAKEEFDILGVPVGEPTIIPPEVQEVKPPELEQLPLRGELVDKTTDAVIQEEQAQLERDAIEGKLSPEDVLLAEQNKLAEQDKLETAPQLENLTIVEEVVEDETKQLLYREYIKDDGTAFESEVEANDIAVERGLDNFIITPTDEGFAIRDNGAQDTADAKIVSEQTVEEEANGVAIQSEAHPLNRANKELEIIETEQAERKGLAMDEPARMERAKKMGFTTAGFVGIRENMAEITEFNPDVGQFARADTGTWVASDPAQASTYAKDGTMPVLINLKDFAQVDFKGTGWNNRADFLALTLPTGETISVAGLDTNQIARLAKEKGVKGVQFDQIIDLGSNGKALTSKELNGLAENGTTQYVIFDAAKIRSPHATFDPDFSTSSDILASKQRDGAAQAEVGQNSPTRFTTEFSNVFSQQMFNQATESGFLTINETSPEGSPAGSFNKETNKITINLDRVEEGESPMSVLLHEGRHAGMEAVLGETLPLFHKDLLNLADGGNVDAQSSIIRSTGAVADKLGIQHTLYDIAMPQSELEAEVKTIRRVIEEREGGVSLLQEEDLAYYIQDAANATELTAPGLYRRIVNALKVWWAQSGIGQMFAQAGLRIELTQEMVVELAKAATSSAIANRGELNGAGIFSSQSSFAEVLRSPEGTVTIEENGYLHGLQINAKERNQGHGKALMNRVIAKADTYGKQLSLHIRRIELIPFYKKFGFTIKGEDKYGTIMERESQSVRELASIPNPLNLKRWWGESSDTPLDANNVTIPEKFRAHIIDNLATIDEKSTDVHKVAEVAKSKSSAEQSKINRLYLEPLVQLAKATGLSREKLDEWLLARHVLLDDENWQNTQKRSWMVARDLAIVMPKELRNEIEKRRVALTKEQTWTDKNGKTTKIPKADVADRMIDLVNEYFARMEGLAQAGNLKPQFTAWKDLQDSWGKIQAHSAGLYSPGKVDANGQLLAGQPKRKNVSNVPDAYDIFHSYSEDLVQQKALQTMAKKWDEMTGHQLDLLVEGGKLAHDEAIAMRTAHPHYVKSRRKSADNDKGFEFLKGGGVGGGKPKVRAGTIEYDPVVHVMQNTIAQAHSNAAAAQQNQAAVYLYREVIGNKDHWDGWFTTHEQEVHHLDAYGFLHDRATSRPEDYDIPVTIMSDDGKSGESLYIRPIPQNQKAKLFAAGFNKLGAQQQGVVAKVLGFGNKVVRNMAVTFSPAFLAANIFRDPATALYNLQATEGKDYTKDFLLGSDGSGRTGLGNAWKILNSVYENRDTATAQHVAWVEEWEHAGGRQSFTQALKEMDDGWKSFEGALKIAKNPAFATGSKILGFVEKYNIIVENVSRFSAYSTVMEAWQRGDIPKWKTQAIAQREAAIISKELTTNFDRKGFSSQSIGLWHLFFNATVQGNVQVVRNVIKSKKLQKMVGGTVVMATMFDILGRAMADDDDEGRNEWDNIPSYIKDRNIIIPFKVNGVYIKIPAPWVYNSVWRMGGMLGELSANKRDMASIPIDTGILLMNTFNPMQSASLMQSLSPTILDPFVQAVENKNFAGNPIKPTSFPGAAALPESQLYFGSTPKVYVGLAGMLNSLSGGDVAKSGFIDISPGVMNNFVNFFAAGVGKAVGQVYTLGEIAVTDKEFEVKNVPVISTYMFSPGKQVDVQLYHTRVAEILQAQKAVDLYGKGKTRDIEKQQESRVKYAKELRLVSQVKDVERQLKSIRIRMKAAQGRKDLERVKQLKTRLISVQQKFNKTYEQRMK